MAPRIANDTYPDEHLQIDYESMGGGLGPMGGIGGINVGIGMGGGGAANNTHDVNEINLDTNNNNVNQQQTAQALQTLAAMAADEELNTAQGGGATVGTQTNNNNTTTTNNTTTAAADSIENDPLSMGHNPSIQHSHSSVSNSDVLMQDNNNTTATNMGTTITVTMAQAAQHAWDVFVAGQEQNNTQHQTTTADSNSVGVTRPFQQMAMEGITSTGGGGESPPSGGAPISLNAVGAGGNHSPSSIAQASSPSTTFQTQATLGGGGGGEATTPSTYQQLMLQARQDGGLLQAPRRTAIPGRPVPSAAAASRASSFGGFPSPNTGGGSNNNRPTSVSEGNVTAAGGPLAPTLEDLIVHHHQASGGGVSSPPAMVTNASRSISTTSSLTASMRGTSEGSVDMTYQGQGHTTTTATLNSPLETIPPSDNEQSGGSSPTDSEGTFASIHASAAFSPGTTGNSPASATATSSSPSDVDSKLSPSSADNEQGSGGGLMGSPKLPYSPSLLDQSSSALDEDDDDDEDDNLGDKYSPILEDKGMDTTADTTMDDDEDEDDTTSSSPQGSSGLVGSHVIQEDSVAAVGSATLPSVTLRPRSSIFSRGNSTSSNDVASSNNVGVPSTVGGGATSTTSATSNHSAAPQGPRGLLSRAEAFELSPNRPQYRHQISDVSVASNDGSVQLHVTPPPLSFGSETTISDLTYYAEKGCIVDVLAALTNPYLKTLGSRMLADYAKMPNRRVAVASNTRILEFVQCTALEIGAYQSAPGNFDYIQKYTSSTWLGREYAVETVRSLTAAEENDGYLMNSPGLLQMLALVARGGPFVQHVPTQQSGGLFGSALASSDPVVVAVPPPTFQDNGTPGPRLMMDNTMGVASDKARLHACIAIMNLSCGKSNKIEITSVKEILEGMRDVMLGRHFSTQPRSSLSSSRASNTLADEARLKATTCIKNLSNADANDAALLATPGLVETLGYVAEATCHPKTGATTCTTHACLALMNLSISKANKNRVFRTPGVMDALMAVITRTAPKANAAATSDPPNPKDPNFEARVKACSALSNLAIGYDNKIPMFNYPGFVESILTVIKTDKAEARTKACSILWSFAAEMKNQVPVVQRGDILPALVSVAKEDTKTEARFKCVAALTLLAESPENAVPLLKAGSLEPLMNVLQEAGPDPTQWRGQTASWCVGFLMNMAQCDDVVPALLQEGIVDLLAPLLSLDHYQSLKAAMAVTFVCQYDTGDKTYNLLRQTENVIPKIVGLLHNTLSGRGGSGYKYGVFTLRSSVGCIASLAAGPDFMKERIATNQVFESLLKVVESFCVDGGTPGAIVGGGKDDSRSVILAIRALSSLIGHLIPEPNCAAMPFGPAMDDKLITALGSFEQSSHPDIDDVTRNLAYDACIRVEGGKNLHGQASVSSDSSPDDLSDDGGGIGLSLARKFLPGICGMNLHVPSDPQPAPALPMTTSAKEDTMDISDDAASATSGDGSAVRTFLLTDHKTGRRFVVPCDPSGGRQFNDNRVWCFRRGRYCNNGELPDSNFTWSDELQAAYLAAITESSSH